MSLLDKSIKFLKTDKSKGLILLFFGRNSLRTKALLEELSNQIEKEKPNINIFSLNVEEDIQALESFIEEMFYYKEKYSISSLKHLWIWPVFLMPGTFNQMHLENIVGKFRKKTGITISLLKPLDFSEEVYPFLLESMKKRI